MGASMWLVVVLFACNPDPKGDTGEKPAPGADVSVPLGPGQARAGIVASDAALFAGIAAEGRHGDVKIYNDRAQFVIQGLRANGSYYIPTASGVIDADIVRPAGQAGRDAVDEWAGMFGIGRLVAADLVEITDDGTTSGTAIVHTEGFEAPMGLITGALELPGFIPALGLRIATDYVLPADSWLMEVRTTITAGDVEAVLAPGDMLMGSFEVIDAWEPGVGLDAPGGADVTWKGYIGKQNDVALGFFAASGATLSTGGLDVLLSSAQISAGFGDSVTIPAGGSITYSRWYGIAPDLAALTSAHAAATGLSTETVQGTVTAPDGPVAGARVNVLVDGEPYTLAVSGDDGSFEADVPAGAAVSYLADGRGRGIFMDLPEGAGSWSPYAAPGLQEQVAASYGGGAVAAPYAQGRGLGTGDGLTLAEPGRIVVRSEDADRFEVRASLTGDLGVDDRLATPRPSGYTALGWARDGEVALTVEPGEYALVVWRGVTAELHQETVAVTAGQDVVVNAELPAAYAHPGWLLADPHMHGSASSDTQIPMEERLIAAAGTGVQVHFGTDHDHIADYRPLLAPLGLDGALRSIVASEMSPVLRGHLNLYPLTVDPAASNNGAWPWYAEPVADTEEELAILRSRHPELLIQSNHPLDGLASLAAWSPGVIGKGDHWSADFDAVEVLNAGGAEHQPFYLDIIQRGQRPVPVGVSDSHSHLAGMPGASATWIPVASLDAMTDGALRDVYASRATIPMRGPFLDVTPTPGQELVGPTHTVTVAAHAPTWIRVDTLELWRDGAVVDTASGTQATFTLAPEKDAVYLVYARGSEPMAPLFGETPWAMTSAWYVDVAGDGFTPPLPPLTVND